MLLMRWRFQSKSNPHEVALRKQTIERIADWWKEFATKTNDLTALFFQRSKWDLPEWTQQHLEHNPPGADMGVWASR
jgi:hypothetical protein